MIPHWAVRRYQSDITGALDVASPLGPAGDPLCFDTWSEVVDACGVIVGLNRLHESEPPEGAAPVVITTGSDVILITFETDG